MSDPLTPPDCDLRGYEWMPLFGARLFSSNFEAHASDLAFRVAIRLYWEAWQQVPAASLPNDDVVLCRLSGLGRNIKAWRKLRADGCLHGFILCSDDRLYHPMLAEEAIKAWDTRQKCAYRRERWRLKKQHQRNDVPGDNPECPPGHPPRRPEGRPNGQEHLSPGMSPRARRTGQEKTSTPRNPPPSGGASRAERNDSAREGPSNPRALGTNPRAGGVAAKPLYRNPFRQMDYEERQRAGLIVIDGLAEETPDFAGFLEERRRVANG